MKSTRVSPAVFPVMVLLNLLMLSKSAGAGPLDFGAHLVFQNEARGATDTLSADLDDDGDLDVLSASYLDDKIAWYENLTAAPDSSPGTFAAQQVITTAANGAYSVYAADLDDDGDLDVLSASADDGKIAWYENLGDPCSPNPCSNGGGVCKPESGICVRLFWHGLYWERLRR